MSCFRKESIRKDLVDVVMFHMQEENGMPLTHPEVAATIQWMGERALSKPNEGANK